MDASITRLPLPSKEHSTCAWCERRFSDVVALLTHVEHAHVQVAA